VSPTGAFFSGGGGHSHAGHESKGDSEPSERAPLDAFLATARQAQLRGPLEIRMGSGNGPVQIRSQTGRAYNDVYLQLDRADASVLSRSTWSDWTWIPRFVALGVNLHEGTFFGRANQLFNTTVATALVWLSVTGFLGWYRRRPGAGLSAPPKRSMRSPRPVVALGVALGVLLPLLGLSMLCILIVDFVFGRWLTPRSAK
jgi:uncharacterized iron-regulated membrane protein